MSKRKLKDLPESLQQDMINTNNVDRHIYGKTHGVVLEHGVNRQKKSNQAYVLMSTKSGYYSEAELINNVLRDELKRLNVKPVIEIDPSTVENTRALMTDSEKAFMLARKYMKDDPSYTLKTIWQRNRNKAICARDVKIVFELVAKIKATKPRLDTN